MTKGKAIATMLCDVACHTINVRSLKLNILIR